MREHRIGPILSTPFRLASEPRLLFKRYLVSNSAFIYYFLTGRL